MYLQANWVLHTFSETNFKRDENLFAALNNTRECLINDKELPVRVEAAFALQALISDSEKAKEYVQPHVKDIIQGTYKLQKIIKKFGSFPLVSKCMCTKGL